MVGCTGLEGEVGYVTVSFSEGAVYSGKNLPRMGFDRGWVHAYFLCTCVCGECVLYLRGVHFYVWMFFVCVVVRSKHNV